MSDDDTGAERRFRTALEAVDAAIDAARGAVREIPNPQRAFEAATELAERLSQAAEVGARLRGQAVLRIRDEEALSLAALGERVGVSKQRVSQMINAATKKPEGKRP